MNCPQCGKEMTRCEEGHPVNNGGPNLARDMLEAFGFSRMKNEKIYNGRTEKEPHWTCLDGSHDAISLFDDGQMENI